MKLEQELLKLKEYTDSCNEVKMQEQMDFIYSHFTSEKDLEKIDTFMRSEINAVSTQTEDLIQVAESTLAQMKLQEIKDIISLSYISKKYFGKNRSWIHQKINGNLKNGKPAEFSADEIKIFNFALQDISRKIGSIAM